MALLPLLKSLTREQLQSRKEQAVRFTRDVPGDPDRAEEIADESLEDYAELIDASFHEHGIPSYFIDRRRPAAYHPLPQVVRVNRLEF